MSDFKDLPMPQDREYTTYKLGDIAMRRGVPKRSLKDLAFFSVLAV
jgi:hypothetical protein